jgi:prepilin peptidase CpaA
MEGLSWTLLAILAGLLIAAAVCDLRNREIPHWIVIAIGLLAPLFWWSTGLAWWPDITWRVGIALIIFGFFAAAFAFGWMGGGDVKLLTVLALWLPGRAVLMLLLLMSFAGGALTLAMVVWSRLRKPRTSPEIPYGVAIAFAGLWLISERFLNQFS